MKKTSVSIGIVAYNEERNIQNVLQDILAQKRTSWTLKHIYIACDGCTDNTVEIVKRIKNKHIKLIINPKREGKAANEQKIFDNFADDVLVMFDADVRLGNATVIEKLIAPLRQKKNVYLTGGNPKPFAPVSFVEKAVYTTFIVLDLSRTHVHKGHSIYGASGQCLALKHTLVKTITFPSNIIAEDDYIYFTNKKHGWGFAHVREAIVHYKLPKTLTDYFRQTQRSDTFPAVRNVEGYFASHVVRDEYARPLAFYLKAIFTTFKTNPLGTAFIIAFRIFSRICSLYTSKHYSLQWFTADTTK